jgi:hypothetical protein
VQRAQTMVIVVIALPSQDRAPSLDRPFLPMAYP